ncbi:Receptor-like protein 12 [Rhynchospora pubera]|uniref:Receptor-like protein 12 n=1 Tax=Rhynchospora pubera TaxID=906938 RepID=A0AAV8DRW9_9POAL|nr:Receptor-like protein 12 [Rhynchospora pubera]
MTKIKNIPSALFSFWVLLLIQATTLATDEEDTRVNITCLPGERAALLTLKAGFVDPKHRLSSWEGHDCCSWCGVTCSKATGHVVKLDLSNTYIPNPEWNPLPDRSYALGGEIRSSLLSLQYLKYLDLSYNNFNYTKIPHFIGSLNELSYLNLSFSNFGGRISPQLGNLTNLQYLDLSSNYYIDGNIPPQLGYLSNLQYLDLKPLSYFTFSDHHPDCNRLVSEHRCVESVSRHLVSALRIIPFASAREMRIFAETLKPSYAGQV